VLDAGRGGIADEAYDVDDQRGAVGRDQRPEARRRCPEHQRHGQGPAPGGLGERRQPDQQGQDDADDEARMCRRPQRRQRQEQHKGVGMTGAHPRDEHEGRHEAR
jgi:hypothetical protein